MSKSKNQQASECLSEIKKLGDSKKAISQIKELLEEFPDFIPGWLELGLIYRKLGDRESALNSFEIAIKLAPNNQNIKLQLSVEQLYFNQVETCRKNLQEILEINPKNIVAIVKLGELYRQEDQRDTALKLFQKALEINPQNIGAKLNLATELKYLGRLDEAIKIIDSVIQQFPENLHAKMLKGNIFQAKPDLIAAANLYKSIISHKPKHLNSRLELAKTYSQLGQIETAITLLEETYQLLGSNINIFIQLGSLNRALEKWEIAVQWYQTACQEYPSNYQGYCHLANLMFLQGEIDFATQLIQKAQAKIPDSLPIIIKSIEFPLQLGNFDLSLQKLKKALKRFPENVQLRWQLCRVHMGQGDYTAALDVLDKISTDNQAWIRQTEQLKAESYFYQYDYEHAEEHFKKAILSAPVATATIERNRLATILMLTGRIEEARQEFKNATKELQLKTSLIKTAIPLKSHPAMVTNELRLNPPLLARLQEVQQEAGEERILAIGSLLMEEPTYLGAALYLARELRAQGIFDNIQKSLSQNSKTLPTIPRRIVQFWDEPEPPQELRRICQSWLNLNPEYQYIRFSLKTAVAFLEEHYDSKVLKAFANCDQPATQADFFRLAYLNKMGGFYADADDLCRQSLDNIVNLNPELVVLQEDFACIGNNFIGCIPGQTMISTAFHKAVNSLSRYCNEGPWFKTGPGLITSVVCSGLLPYLTYDDYQIWPRLLVLSQAQLRKIVNQHMPLAYKRTTKNWRQNAYQRRIKVML